MRNNSMALTWFKKEIFKIDHRSYWLWPCRPLGQKVWKWPRDVLCGSKCHSNKLITLPLYVKTGLGLSKKALCSTQGIRKMGHVKSLSLLMKSLCTEPHTCTVSITTVKQEGKSRQCCSIQQTHRWSRCSRAAAMLFLYIMNSSEIYQLWMSCIL